MITKLAILGARKPKAQHVAVLACASYEHVLQTMQAARAELLEIVSAVEFWDRPSLDLVLKHVTSQSTDWGEEMALHWKARTTREILGRLLADATPRLALGPFFLSLPLFP